MLDLNNYKDIKENLILKLWKKINTHNCNNEYVIKYLINDIVGKELQWEDYKKICKTVNKKNCKTYRLRKLIKKIFEKYEEPIFITLTFTEEHVKMKNHRRRVQDFLNQECEYYVANIDYGTEKERMHYHCVGSNRINPTKWKYGNCDVKKIHTKNEGALSEYITKLSQHATKTTTNQERIITKRRTKK